MTLSIVSYHSYGRDRGAKLLEAITPIFDISLTQLAEPRHPPQMPHETEFPYDDCQELEDLQHFPK